VVWSCIVHEDQAIGRSHGHHGPHVLLLLLLLHAGHFNQVWLQARLAQTAFESALSTRIRLPFVLAVALKVLAGDHGPPEEHPATVASPAAIVHAFFALQNVRGAGRAHRPAVDNLDFHLIDIPLVAVEVLVVVVVDVHSAVFEALHV